MTADVKLISLPIRSAQYRVEEWIAEREEWLPYGPHASYGSALWSLTALQENWPTHVFRLTMSAVEVTVGPWVEVREGEE